MYFYSRGFSRLVLCNRYPQYFFSHFIFSKKKNLRISTVSVIVILRTSDQLGIRCVDLVHGLDLASNLGNLPQATLWNLCTFNYHLLVPSAYHCAASVLGYIAAITIMESTVTQHYYRGMAQLYVSGILLIIVTIFFWAPLGIVTGNPGVFQGDPYPYPRKPTPTPRVQVSTVRGVAWTWSKKPQTQNTHTSRARLYEWVTWSTQNSVVDTIKSWLWWWVCKCSKSLRTVSSQTLPRSLLFCGEELFTIKSRRFGSSLDMFSFEECTSFYARVFFYWE